MSDEMMFGIAKMPYEMAMGDEMSRRQFYANTQRLVAALATAQAEAREWRERSAHVDRGATRLAVEKDTLAQALARVRELTAKWRAATQNPDEPLLAMAADELEAALSQAAEQHDPLAVSDHCGECGEPEPECVCDERESLPLMAPATAARVLNDEAQRPLGRRYRVTDTDEHGLKVIPRTADMPEGAKYRGWTESTQRWSYYTRYIKRHAHDRFERIEDYRPEAQESGDALD